MMAENRDLEIFQELHRDLTNIADILKEDREERGRLVLAQLPDNPLLDAVAGKFQRLLDKPRRKNESRDAVLSGKVRAGDEEWEINKEFQEIILQVADEIDLDEIETTQLALQAEDDEETLGRSRKECTIIRFHQQRKYLLSCMLLLLELSKEEDELLGDDAGDDLGRLAPYVDENILRHGIPGVVKTAAKQRFVPACAAAQADIRAWLQRLSEQVNGAAMYGRGLDSQHQETFEFTHISLIQQHELLAVILCYAIERHRANEDDFVAFLREFGRANRYDYSIGKDLRLLVCSNTYGLVLTFVVHLVPVLGTYITIFGSTEGSGSLEQARRLNAIICQQPESTARTIPFLDAAVKAWWIVEYSGWYLEDAAGSGLTGIDLDQGKRTPLNHSWMIWLANMPDRGHTEI